jgi:glycosyltransferase involved in cell wall biosynthesis
VLRPLRFDHARRVPGASLRVMLFTEYLDATYYVYFHYILGALADDSRVSFYVMSSATVTAQWANPSRLVSMILRRVNPHLVVMNRYALPYGVELVEAFRRRGVPVLYHIDDDLLAVPAELGTAVSEHHGDPKITRQREVMLNDVDAIQPSTAPLAERLRTRVPRTKVLEPNHPPYAAALLGAGPESADERAVPIIGYMASKSHRQDLELILPAIVSLMEARPDVRFEIFGTLPVSADLGRRFAGRVLRHEAVGEYSEFLRRLARMRWSVGLAPLLPTAFNDCKSAVKYLEYTACGIPTVASAVPAYRLIDHGRNGLVADGLERWSQSIGKLLDDRICAVAMVRQARQDCEAAFGFASAKARLFRIMGQLAASPNRSARSDSG